MNPTEEEQRQSFISTESIGNLSRRRVSFRLRQLKYNTEHSFSLFVSVMKIQRRRNRSGDTRTVANVKLKVNTV